VMRLHDEVGDMPVHGVEHDVGDFPARAISCICEHSYVDLHSATSVVLIGWVM
jgi:hypothetical protein